MDKPEKTDALENQWGVPITKPVIDPKKNKGILKMKKGLKGAGSANRVCSLAEKKEIGADKQILTSPGITSSHPLLIDESGVTARGFSPTPEGNKRPRRNNPERDLSTVNIDNKARRLQEELDAQLNELELHPFINDLAACKRISDGGLELFRRAYSEYPLQLARALKENRELKAQVNQLQGVQTELAKVNQEISVKNKQLEELPKTKAEVERAQKAEKALRKESSELKASVEELKKEKATAVERERKAGADGFQQAFNLTAFLAPWVNLDYYDGNHVTKDDKIWLKREVVITGDEYRKMLEEAAVEAEKSLDEQTENPDADGELGTGGARVL